MTKLTSKNEALTLSLVADAELMPARRYLVLVPDLKADLDALMQRVWELASVTGIYVKFIGLCDDASQELSLRRSLVTMSALANDGRMPSEVEVIIGGDWVSVVKSRWQPGDMVVCFAEQSVGLPRKPLSQILRSDLNVPLYILSGLYPQRELRSNWSTWRAVMWSGFAAIVIVFFTIQVKIIQTAGGWTSALLLIFTSIEFWLIWAWNKLFA
jgi:hypothetical protein